MHEAGWWPYKIMMNNASWSSGLLASPQDCLPILLFLCLTHLVLFIVCFKYSLISNLQSILLSADFLLFFFYPRLRICLLILESGGGSEREREREPLMWERNIDWLLPICSWNLGMCPDRELNPKLFGVRDTAPTNWASWVVGARAADCLFVSQRKLL